MTITRKTFCASLAGSSVTLLLQACGGGGGYSSPGTPATPGSTCGASGIDISDNHGHALTIPKADLDLATDKTYALTPGSDGHTHSVSFTVDELRTLKGGASVTVTSTSATLTGAYGGMHSHSVKATVLSSCP